MAVWESDDLSPLIVYQGDRSIGPITWKADPAGQEKLTSGQEGHGIHVSHGNTCPEGCIQPELPLWLLFYEEACSSGLDHQPFHSFHKAITP